ncbi:uncharacterized protein LOC125658043 [Ostrea edulis]|uniref:uncharacterized protein LOC125658043 n=1 Tax=Ostrea edulis TaxID=37623 RepID=UPI0020948DA0|nr:uncharacterized protein LOC125658043 [Ostrea edulis]
MMVKSLLLLCTLLVCRTLADKYVNFGCMKEVHGRLLRAKAGNLKVNSPWHCQAFCKDYLYFGVQFGKECFCGNTFSGNLVRISKCTMRCSGNSLLYCGGHLAIDVYATIS